MTYRKPQKQSAYLTAQQLAAELDETIYTESAIEFMIDQTTTQHTLSNEFTLSDARDVCAKALRIERGRRAGTHGGPRPGAGRPVGSGDYPILVKTMVSQEMYDTLTMLANRANVSMAEIIRQAISSYYPQ